MVSSSRASRFGILLATLLASGPAEAGFTIRDLGVLAPGGTSKAEAINAKGQVAGTASRADGSTVAVVADGGGTFHAVNVGNATSSSGNAIDGSGDIAGTLTDPSDHLRHAFSMVGNSFHKFSPLKVNGQPGFDSQANAISSSGEVVGTGTVPGLGGTANHVAFQGTDPANPTIIKPLGGGRANFGAGINAEGTVVGTSEISMNGPLHAFLATSGGAVTDLVTRNLPGSFTLNTEGRAINDSGDVVGGGIIGSREHAFFASHSNAALVDIGLLDGISSVAFGVNNLLDPFVVGAAGYGSGGSRAFLWQASAGIIDLTSLLSIQDHAAWLLNSANAINDSNQIVGVGTLNGMSHGFLLTPNQGEPLFSPAGSSAVPVPPAFALVAVGMTLVVAQTRSRRARARGRDAS